MEDKKKIIGIGIAVITAVVLIIGIITTIRKVSSDDKKQGEVSQTTVQKSDGTTVNISEKIKENKEIKGFKISNGEIKEKNGQTELVALVTNETGLDQSGFLVNVVLYDKEEKELGKIPASIIATKAGETIRIRAGITIKNYVEAYDFKLEER